MLVSGNIDKKRAFVKIKKLFFINLKIILFKKYIKTKI